MIELTRILATCSRAWITALLIQASLLQATFGTNCTFYTTVRWFTCFLNEIEIEKKSFEFILKLFPYLSCLIGKYTQQLHCFRDKLN